MFNMRFTSLSILLLIPQARENLAIKVLVPRQAATACIILPFDAPGNEPCGFGSIIVPDCQCCQGQFTCSNLIQFCGVSGCVDNPAYFPGGSNTGCATDQHVCGTGCMPQDAVCCAGGGSYCNSGYQCENGSDQCIPDSSGSPSVSTKPGLATATAGPAASQSVGEAIALGWECTAWKLLAIEAMLLFFA
jgi:hypothetical protein